MDVCNGCAFEFGWTQQSTSVPNECKGCQMVNGKPSNYKPKPQTNADRIRAMSDEELAKIIICPKQVCDKLHILVGRTDCEACSLEWLKQPADMRGEEDG